ncbi:MAG: nucleotidyltransferase domain-containing protein [Muribaculaceae bacterium]|nr:nucleotidyltransferase domain-containing protein [Muribaculaceae bacterium]
MTHYNRVLNEIRKLANKLFVNLPASVYLYGSRARGDADENSDWDILIITDDSITTNDAFERFAFPFTEIGWHLGEQITPLLYTKSEWNAERNTAFYLNVETDAIRL